MKQSLRWFQGKQLLALIRGGDYAHAGEENAIEQSLEQFPKNGERNVLDVGCGLGGTASFIQQQGWGRVVGIDLEAQAIEYAQKKYPDVEFHVSDASQIDTVLGDSKKFDLICLFNSFYAFPDKTRVLQAMRKLAAENANLVIFDYTDLTTGSDSTLIHNIDPSQYFVPIRPNEFSEVLRQTNWKPIETKTLNKEYEQWYIELLQHLESRREDILKQSDPALYERAQQRYTEILKAIQNNTLGGSIFYARA